MARQICPSLRRKCQPTLHVALACLLALLLVGPAAPAGAEISLPSDAPLQFTSAGHVLAFSPGGIVAAAGSHAYRVEFVDAAVTPVADTPPAAGEASGAPPLSRVTYPDLWPGISLAYDAPDGTLLHSTYRLAPFADPDRIRLRYNAPVELESDGGLALHYATGAMRESAPVAWQDIGGRHVPVEVAFRLIQSGAAAESRQVGFRLGAYDPAHPLTIDPSLTWNTFLGGSDYDAGYGIAVDGSGSVYVVGQSSDTWGSPTRVFSGSVDAFVAKLDSSGAVQWNTFLGGIGVDYGRSIALDGSRNVYLMGESYDTWGSPVRDYTANVDAFVARLDSSGALQWNTFLGGIGADYAHSIAVGGSGNVYVAGDGDATWGSPVRDYAANVDAFAARLDSTSGALQWNTFLGGIEADFHPSIAVGRSGDAYMAATSEASWGSSIHPHSGNRDAFAARLDSDGALQWHTFLGGSAHDQGHGIAVDESGNIHIVGYSDATWGSPVHASSGGGDVLVARLGSGGALQWHTFVGGSEVDWGDSIAVDGSGNVYVAGYSIASWGSPVRPHSGFNDALVAGLDASGALQWNTFLGESGIDYGRSIAVDGGGNVYVAGWSHAAWGSPVRNHSGGMDAFAAKLSPAPEMDVQGNGQSIPNGATTPSPADYTDFGTTIVSSGPLVHTFTLRNIGDADLHLTGLPRITLARGTQFAMTAQPSSPVPGSSATAFEITFAPSAAGTFTDTVHIANDDGDENPYTFMISGAAIKLCYLPLIFKSLQ